MLVIVVAVLPDADVVMRAPGVTQAGLHEPTLVVVGVEHLGDLHLADVAQAGDAARGASGGAEGGQEQAQQQSDDADDDEEFDECESPAGAKPAQHVRGSV